MNSSGDYNCSEIHCCRICYFICFSMVMNFCTQCSFLCSPLSCVYALNTNDTRLQKTLNTRLSINVFLNDYIQINKAFWFQISSYFSVIECTKFVRYMTSDLRWTLVKHNMYYAVSNLVSKISWISLLDYPRWISRDVQSFAIIVWFIASI